MHKLLRYTGQNPAVGTDLSWMPANADEVSLVSIVATLTTAVAVASRVPDLVITDRNGDVIWRQAPTSILAASGTLIFCWSKARNTPATFAGSTTMSLPLLDDWLPDGAVVKTVTAGIQAADQWSAMSASYYAKSQWIKDQWITELAKSIDNG